ncbi:hypothetical protein ACIA4R_03100 [Lactobacillus delbrueckii subsp. bulgaricus]
MSNRSLLLALLFAWLLPTGLDLIRLWPNPPKHMADALAAFKRLLGKLDLQTVMGFGGYYMAGYYFSQAHMSKRNLYFSRPWACWGLERQSACLADGEGRPFAPNLVQL